MKLQFVIMICVATLMLSGCVNAKNNNISSFDDFEMVEKQVIEDNILEEDENIIDDSIYIGEYLDYDVSEPNLEIAKGEDGKYIVQIGIFRLTTLEDGVGELTAEGMTFTATDAAGNPIGGIITVEDDIATVTFTDSTWDLIENGTVYQYSKSSDVPNVWGE